jgi:hypothetical protein
MIMAVLEEIKLLRIQQLRLLLQLMKKPDDGALNLKGRIPKQDC